MDWIDKIKDTLGAWKLSHQVKVEKGIVNIPNFKDIQDIGLIYNATQAKEEEQITRIAHYLRDQGKKVQPQISY
jgi:ABC-type uncharacterized transport system substrate-binding protein